MTKSKTEWERIKANPVLLAKKRARVRLYSRALYEIQHPGCAAYTPGICGPKPDPVKRAANVAAREARRREAVSVAREAKAALRATLVPGCSSPSRCRSCSGWFRPEEVDADRRCRGCNRIKRRARKERLKRENPDHYRALKRLAKHRRRALKLQAGGVFTAAYWRQILDRFDGRCAHCGTADSLTIDHVIPLSMGGSNDWTNVQPLCHWHNSLKGASLTGSTPPNAVDPRW